MPDNQNQDESKKVQDIEAEANRIREEIAQAKADHISADSAEADKIRQDVENIKKAAAQLSPEAFSDLSAADDHKDPISD